MLKKYSYNSRPSCPVLGWTSFLAVYLTSPVLHTHFVYITFIRRTSGRSLRTSEKKKECCYSYREALKINVRSLSPLSPSSVVPDVKQSGQNAVSVNWLCLWSPITSSSPKCVLFQQWALVRRLSLLSWVTGDLLTFSRQRWRLVGIGGV